MPIRRLRRALLITVTVLTMLFALPAATIARGAHKSSSCHATSTTAHKSAVRKCAKPKHKANPRHASRHKAHSRHKHKAKHPAAGIEEEAEDESEGTCEEGAVETYSGDSGPVCEASEEEQEG